MAFDKATLTATLTSIFADLTEKTAAQKAAAVADAIDAYVRPAAALYDLVDTQLGALATAFGTWVVVPMDGGAALKTLLAALIAGGWPATTGSPP